MQSKIEVVILMRMEVLAHPLRVVKMDRQAWIDARTPVLTMAEIVPRYCAREVSLSRSNAAQIVTYSGDDSIERDLKLAAGVAAAVARRQQNG